MREHPAFVAIMTVLGVLLGGVVWFITYSTLYTPTIEFNGPAQAALGLSLVAGGLVLGLLSIGIYARNNPKRSLVQAFTLLIVSSFIACVVLGSIISKYEINHTGHCVEPGPHGSCLDG